MEYASQTFAFDLVILLLIKIRMCIICYSSIIILTILYLSRTVHPVIQVPNQLVGAPLGTDVTLECYVESSPKSINYWVKDPGKSHPSNPPLNPQYPLNKLTYDINIT